MRRATIVVICILIAVCAGLVGSPDYAASQSKSAKEKKIKENRGKRDKVYDKIRELNSEQDKLGDIIAIQDGQIESIENEISNITEQLDSVAEKCDELKAEQQQLENNIGDYKNRLSGRVREIYMQGEFTYMEMVLQAADFGDAIDRMYFVQTILERDREMVTNAKRDQVELGRKMEQIQVQIGEIDRIRQILQGKRESLEHERGEKQLIMEAINSDKALLEKQAKEFEEENKRLQKEIKELIARGTGYSGQWKGNFIKPCAGGITSGYGIRVHPIYGTKKMHTGIDIGASSGSTVKSGGDGKVIFTGWRSGYGKTVIIDHGGGKTTLYAHLSKISCDTGNTVSAGAKIGEVGSTGDTTGPHLHFEVRVNGDHVDPWKHL